MQQHWKVGDLASLTGLTVRTLRYYDQIGLFSPSGHSGSGHRMYNEADIQRLQKILSLKDLGLSLEEIKRVLEGQTYSSSEIVAIQIERVRKHMKIQQKLLAELERVAEKMNQQEPLSIDAFLSFLESMKQSQEKYIIDHRLNWESHLDLLGEFLNDK
ncbi:MerR family transcriptional regulator [Brevibacillus centrosporus]|uniref:MerR family transcriptional regulator n=1 Tax=Brevibacillus centrosporus TaxID=54910 RepID=UPI002E1F5AFF|nr:MerR family transcriptional regulator [Brevibacillus centrosporus]MED1951118.1 MerR family transcriptional regulator [Brevibacillus centrosporus]